MEILITSFPTLNHRRKNEFDNLCEKFRAVRSGRVLVLNPSRTEESKITMTLANLSLLVNSWRYPRIGRANCMMIKMTAKIEAKSVVNPVRGVMFDTQGFEWGKQCVIP